MNYYEAPGVSQTALKQFMRSPAHYQHYVSPQNKAKESQAFRIGRALHTSILEPADYYRRYAVCPEKVDRRFADGKKKWAEFESASQGKTILSSKATKDAKGDLSHDQVMGMRQSILSNDACAVLLKKGKSEQPFFWVDDATGIACKGLVDHLYPVGIEGAKVVLCDIKTTRSAHPDEFARDAKKYGIALQLAFYARGLRANGLDPVGFVIMAVEKTPPYISQAYEITFEAVEAADRLISEHLYKLVECQDQNVWPGYFQNSQIQILDL